MSSWWKREEGREKRALALIGLLLSSLYALPVGAQPLPPAPFAGGVHIAAVPAPEPITRNVTLAWDASIDPTVTGYKVYWGAAPGHYTNSVNAGPELTARVSNLLSGQTYYFAATAYNSLELESDFSNEVSYTVPLPPPPPANLRVTLTMQASGAQGGPYVTLPLPPVILTNSLATGAQFYRLQIGAEPIP